MVHVETEQICQLEHFFSRELDSGMSTPFKRCIRINQSEAVKGSQEMYKD